MISPFIVTPTNSPVILPSLTTMSLIIPESENIFPTAASVIFAKSMFAYVASRLVILPFIADKTSAET